MQQLRRVTAPVEAVATAARRGATYGGHARELASSAITVAMWPLGISDPGHAAFPSPEAPTAVQTPVLLVHGFGANKSNWFLVRRHLEQAGFGRIHAVNYNPFAADIPGLAAHVAERARALQEHLGVDRVHIVGHSLGGVIARYAVAVDGLEGVGACATIASPHGGVRIARHGSALARVSPLASGLQLRPDSTVMRRLRSSVAPGPTRYTAYYSNLDLIVPARRAMIVEPELEATNILVKDHGHLSIMLSRRLASSVVAQLGAVEGLPGYGSPVVPLDARRQPSSSGAAAAASSAGH